MKRIRLIARVVPQPCIFLDKCQGACDWCKTHMYTEACVGMLQHQCDCLRKNWVAAERDKVLLQKEMEQNEKVQKGMYTLDEIAVRICNSIDAEACETCPATNYCKAGHNGMLDWLREVMK